jgi:hypothetical protein
MSAPKSLSRTCAFPADISARHARDAYLAENGFTVQGYEAEFGEGSFLGIRIRIPNPPSRRRAVRIHDLHHAITGFGTDLAGEGEISGWEISAGFLRHLNAYVRVLVILGFALGLLCAPRRTWRAWRLGRGCRSLAGVPEEYERLLERNMGELRDLTRVPRAGIASTRRGLHSRAPKPGDQAAR